MKKILLFLIIGLFLPNLIYSHPGHNGTDHLYYYSGGDLKVNGTAVQNWGNQTLNIERVEKEESLKDKLSLNKMSVGLKSTIISYLNKDGTWFLVSLLGLAFLLGVIHTFSPGHGKAMIASYLVGERATYKDGVILGVSFASTHVIDVFLAMIVFFFILKNKYIDTFTNILSLISVSLLFLFAAYQLRKAIMHLIHELQHKKGIKHKHHHHPEHHHHHHHGHSHSHGGHSHSHGIDKNKPFLVGIISGLAPCPMAWTLFLLALSVNKMGLGLFMILAFSTGVMLTVVAVSVVVLRFKNTVFKGKRAKNLAVYLPVVGYTSLTLLSLFLILSQIL